MLKLKSKIYKYTGIYLADREENDYLKSDEFWKRFIKIIKSKNNDIGPRNVQGILIGMWQAHNGFARPYSFLRLRRPALLWRPIGWFCVLYKTIRWDLSSLRRSLCKKKSKNKTKKK